MCGSTYDAFNEHILVGFSINFLIPNIITYYVLNSALHDVAAMAKISSTGLDFRHAIFFSDKMMLNTRLTHSCVIRSPLS